MIPVFVALPFVAVGVVVWKHAKSETGKKLGAAIACIALIFAGVVVTLELLPRWLAPR